MQNEPPMYAMLDKADTTALGRLLDAGLTAPQPLTTRPNVAAADRVRDSILADPGYQKRNPNIITETYVAGMEAAAKIVDVAAMWQHRGSVGEGARNALQFVASEIRTAAARLAKEGAK